MAKTMTMRNMRYWRQEFEQRAVQAGARGHRDTWQDLCAKVWTLEFVLGDVGQTGYRQPQARIPFTEQRYSEVA
jgi:hypothetical protein